MPLNPLMIDTNYFSSVEARNDLIKAADFDGQFASISTYLNKSVVPTLNQLISNQIPGSTNPIDANKYLVNVGDGSVRWDTPSAELIEDGTINITKLVGGNPSSVIISDNNGVLKPLTPSTSGLALASRSDNPPIWKKIVGNESISNRAITGEKIAKGSLKEANFNVSLAKAYIKGIIKDSLIRPKTISSSKIANEAITQNVFSQNMLNQFFGANNSPMVVHGHTLQDNAFNNMNMDHVELEKRHLSAGFVFSERLYSKGSQFYSANFEVLSITGDNISDNSIDGTNLFLAFSGQFVSFLGSLPEIFAEGSIGVENIPPQWRRALGL